MTATFTALIIATLVFLIINLIVQIRVAQIVSAHLRNGHDYCSFINARHQANRGLILGGIFSLLWLAIGRGIILYGEYLPTGYEIVTAIFVIALIAANLLAPLHHEEHVDLKRISSAK